MELFTRFVSWILRRKRPPNFFWEIVCFVRSTIWEVQQRFRPGKARRYAFPKCSAWNTTSLFEHSNVSDQGSSIVEFPGGLIWLLTFCKSKRLQLIYITYCIGFPNSWLSWWFFEPCQISNSLPALGMGWPTRALSRSKSGGTSLCITVALQEIRSLRGLQGRNAMLQMGSNFIISISWMMILVTCNTWHLGHLHQPHQLVGPCSFSIYLGGRLFSGSMPPGDRMRPEAAWHLGKDWASSRDSRVGIRCSGHGCISII